MAFESTTHTSASGNTKTTKQHKRAHRQSCCTLRIRLHVTCVRTEKSDRLMACCHSHNARRGNCTAVYWSTSYAVLYLKPEYTGTVELLNALPLRGGEDNIHHTTGSYVTPPPQPPPDPILECVYLFSALNFLRYLEQQFLFRTWAYFAPRRACLFFATYGAQRVDTVIDKTK